MPEKEWRWLATDVVLAIHDRQISRYGGLEGLRDVGAFESALARPQNLAVYGTPDAADLAAAYACGLARNHAFADANKRTAWAAAHTFLIDNGCDVRLKTEETVAAMLEVATGAMAESDFAQWLRARLV
ncbi:MAG TPA: type II toxin-antitoxin system death-on-curing family toxin [Alphaproteobacteria bacterium]|nr:type II toxin-antitoxin system death-on-curing family toxin [Alphaproteobacteria bacterium]